MPELSLEMYEEDLADYAASVTHKASRWTPEHDALLIKAREEHGLTWGRMAIWWKKKFGWGSDKTLNQHYKEIKEK